MAIEPIIIAVVLLSLISHASSISSKTLLNAARNLSNSGFLSMSLTIELESETLISQHKIKSATIFSPEDSAFAASGQPSLSLLQLHFSPLSLHLESLRSLPYGSRIPTLSPGKFLFVTTNPHNDQVSLNNITISGSPIYDDGWVTVYGTDSFFNPNFSVSVPITIHDGDFQCATSTKNVTTLFDGVSGVLKSRGYAMMASFVDLQLLGFHENRKLTVFAPADNVMVEYADDFPDYPSLFLRHVLPCKITWTDMFGIQNGTVLGTYLQGFSLNVTKSGSGVAFIVNGIPITSPDIYTNDWLVVHGLREILLLPESTEREGEGESLDEISGN